MYKTVIKYLKYIPHWVTRRKHYKYPVYTPGARTHRKNIINHSVFRELLMTSRIELLKWSCSNYHPIRLSSVQLQIRKREIVAWNIQKAVVYWIIFYIKLFGFNSCIYNSLCTYPKCLRSTKYPIIPLSTAVPTWDDSEIDWLDS